MGEELIDLEKIKRAHITIFPDKRKEDGSLYTETEFEEEFNSIEKALNEHEQYKVIEEIIGIDLKTLFKALTDSIAIKNEDGTIIVMWACPRFQISIDKSDSWILYGPVEEHKYVSIKDYGKTWALKREELL